MIRFFLACACVLSCANHGIAEEPWSEPLMGMYFKDQAKITTTYSLLYAREPSEQDIVRTAKLAEALLAAEGKKTRAVIGPSPGNEPRWREMIVLSGTAELRQVAFESSSDTEKTYFVQTAWWDEAASSRYGAALSAYVWQHDTKARIKGASVTVSTRNVHAAAGVPFSIRWTASE